MVEPRRLAIRVQVSHIALSIAWNLIGLSLISLGEQSIGPTASYTTVLVLFCLGLMLFVAGSLRFTWIYVCVSTVLLLGILSAVYGGFTKPHTLWLSEFWRYFGITVNVVGCLGFYLAIRSIRTIVPVPNKKI